jgi:hypothetical protein
MSAVIRTCKSETSFKNTGAGSNLFPAATAMVILCDKNFKFTVADLNNPDVLSAFTEWVHEAAPDKVYPLFGNSVTISGIVNTKGTDNTITLDDGTVIFVSYTQYTKVFSTTDGGLCFAKALKSFNNADMRVMEVDIKGNLICKDNHDGTYGGLKATLYAPAIDMADIKNPARSYFSLAYMPDYFIDNAAMLANCSPLLDLSGLMDLTVKDAGGSSITALHVKIIDDCCGDDVTADYQVDLIKSPGNIVVKNQAGAAVPVTAITYTAATNLLNLAGTFTAATSYDVSGANPSVLFTGGVEGVYINQAKVKVP